MSLFQGKQDEQRSIHATFGPLQIRNMHNRFWKLDICLQWVKVRSLVLILSALFFINNTVLEHRQVLIPVEDQCQCVYAW